MLQRFFPRVMDALLMFMFVGKMRPELPAPGAAPETRQPAVTA